MYYISVYLPESAICNIQDQYRKCIGFYTQKKRNFWWFFACTQVSLCLQGRNSIGDKGEIVSLVLLYGINVFNKTIEENVIKGREKRAV